MSRVIYQSSRKRSKPCTCLEDQTLGSRIGSTIGGGIQKYGPMLGKLVMARFTGGGDYQLKSNSLVAGSSGTDMQNVQIIPGGPRSTRIVYKEYIGDVYTDATTAGAFNIKGYNLNPALMSTFPWLSTIAQQFEQWTPNGIIFEFRSTSSEYTATQALGSVIMATEYDPVDTPYTNKQQMLNAAYSSEMKPSERGFHGVECDPRDNPNRIFYTRAASIPAGTDIRDYDLGTFYIATQGSGTTNLNLGSLYIHYDITLRKEQIFGGVSDKGQLFASYQLNGANSTQPIGSTAPTKLSGTLGSTDLVPDISYPQLIFPYWTTGVRWKITYIYVMSAALNTGGVIFNASGGTGTAVTTRSSATGGNTRDSLFTVCLIDQTKPLMNVTVSAAGGGVAWPGAGTTTFAYLYIEQVSIDYTI